MASSSAVLSHLPDLPALVETASSIDGKPMRVKPRVNLGEITPNNLGTVKKLHSVLFPVSYTPRFFTDLLDPSLTPEDYSKLVHYQDVPVGVLVTRLEPKGWEEPRTVQEAVGKKGEETEGEVKVREGEGFKLYVMTLGVLSPYRRQGLASKLVHHLLTTAAASHSQQPPSAPSPPPSAPVASTSSAPPPTASNSTASSSKKSKKAKKGEAPASAVDEKKDEKKADVATEEVEEPPKPRIESVYLHVQVGNEEAKRFWEKFGFEVKDTISNYYRKIEPRDAWLLERKIEPVSAASSS